MDDVYLPEERYFIETLADIVHNKTIPPPAERFDWGLFYTLCRNHNLSGMVGVGLKKNGVTVPAEIQSCFVRDGETNLYYEVQRHLIAENIFSRFDRAKIPFVPLKGCVIRHFYPSPEFRTMGDVDLLVKKADVADIRKILSEEGFTYVDQADRHLGFFKPPLFHLELHHTYYHPAEATFQSGVPTYYCDEQVWSRMLPCEGTFRYEPDRIDFFLMFFLHLARHFMEHGIGIRYILDYTILKNHFGYSLKEHEIADHLNELGLTKFASHIDRIADIWFENDATEPFYNRLGHYILDNTVHGEKTEIPTMKLARLSSESQNGTKRSKLKFIQTLFFPPRLRIKANYPHLAAIPPLLPLCYIHWILCRFFKLRNWKHYWTLLTSVLKISSKEIHTRTMFYDEMGLRGIKQTSVKKNDYSD